MGKKAIAIEDREHKGPERVNMFPDKHSGYKYLGKKYYPVLCQLEHVQAYRLAKEDLLTGAQQAVLRYALSEDKLKKASFMQLIQGFEILNKALRLESNQSTDNIAHGFGAIQIAMEKAKE